MYSDLSDREWTILKPLIPLAKSGGCPSSGELRRILKGILYMLRSDCCDGCLLPDECTAWSAVYDWRNEGVS